MYNVGTYLHLHNLIGIRVLLTVKGASKVCLYLQKVYLYITHIGVIPRICYVHHTPAALIFTHFIGIGFILIIFFRRIS